MSTTHHTQGTPLRPARVGAVAGPRQSSEHGVTEMVPIEHETPDRMVRTLVFVLPPAALGVAGWLAWGGTLSINSLCHSFGRRPFRTGDQSRNLAWLAPLAFGEAWHNNHHAFPTLARHGLGRWQLDPGAWLIAALERSHLAWDVIQISPSRQRAKRGSAVAG